VSGEQNQSQQSSGSQQQQGGSGAGSDGGSNQSSQQQAAPVRPDAFADKAFDPYWNAEKGVDYGALGKDFNDLRAHKAQDDLRRAAVPAKSDDYKLALPQTFKLPNGPDGKPIAFQFDDADPRLPAARAWAHARGLDQTGFSELLAIQVQADLADQELVSSGRTKEVEKLGVNGPARIDAVGTWLKSMLGTDKGAALLDRLVLADDIGAMEDLIKKFSTQGSGSFNQQHREGGAGKFDEDEYQKSGPPGSAARVAYMQKHGQQSNGKTH
jgi:hypothetical protein